MLARGGWHKSTRSIVLIGFLAGCSVDLSDLTAGTRDANSSPSGAGGDAGAAGDSGGTGGSATGGAAGNAATDGWAGQAGRAGADRDGGNPTTGSGGASGSGGFAGTGGIAGSGGMSGGIDGGQRDGLAGAAGIDASADGAAGAGGQAGAGGTAGTGGDDAGNDGTVVLDSSRDTQGPSDTRDAGVLCQAGACKRVFVSADPPPTGGDFGGFTGGDAFCQSAADTYDLGGAWKAWLSDGTTSVSARLAHETVPYVLLDGTMVAANWSALTSGSLAHAIDLSEDGTIHTTYEVWTGTTSAGAISGHSCSGWTTNASGSVYAEVGLSGETTTDWTNVFAQYCDRLNVHLYCVEQ